MLVEIVTRVVFLIGLSGVGYGVGRMLHLNPKDIAALLIYVISPFVIFLAIVQSPADWSYLVYSLGALLTASIAGVLAYRLGRRLLWPDGDGRANLFGFAGGTGNTGYFALPLVFALFDAHQVAVAVFIIIGVNLYEFTVGYFITARGVMNTRQSVIRIARLPTLYAALAGMACKTLGIELGQTLASSLENFKGAYSVLGMMVIGITLATYRALEVDWKFLVCALGWKHLLYPVVGILVFGSLLNMSAATLAVIVLMLATPMAANTVVIAAHLGVHPEKAALAVMVSTLLAAVTVPFAVFWLF